MPTLRFLAIDARRSRIGVRRLAALIDTSAPDLVCVHGAPNGPRWRTVAGALARQAGLVVVGGGRPAGANLLLSSLALDVASTRDVRLSASRMPRTGAALAVLSRQGSVFAVAAACLAGGPVGRRAQVGALERALADLTIGELPAVLSVAGAEPLSTPAVDALARSRTMLPGGVFLDRRITAGAVRQVDGAPETVPALFAELVLPVLS